MHWEILYIPLSCSFCTDDIYDTPSIMTEQSSSAVLPKVSSFFCPLKISFLVEFFLFRCVETVCRDILEFIK